jgi:hypothetical protein
MDTQLETIDYEGNVPKSRFKDAESCRKAYLMAFEDDKPAAAKRAENQLMFDGAPPYTPGELERAGQKHRTNFNAGEARDLLLEALGAYIDMLQSVPVLFDAPTTFGATPGERTKFGKGVCRAISKMMKRWPDFFLQYMLNATKFIQQGVSFTVFDDDIDWRFKVKGLSDFIVPRDSPATEDGIEVVWIRGTYTVSKLYDAIRNEKAAKEMGWDVDAVKELLKKSCKSSDHGNAHKTWEDVATELRTDDLALSMRSGSIDVVSCLVKEFDGTVTQHLFPLTGDKTFLRTRKKKYKSMREGFTLFAYSVGNNGKLYEIRGLGANIFPLIQVSNRMYCQGIDGAMLGSSMMVQPQSISDLGKAQLAFYGPYSLLHPGAKIIERNVPNYAQNTQPVVRQMSDLIRVKAGAYTSSRALPENSDMSAYEANARVSNAAGMTVTNLILFLVQFEKLLVQMVNRIKRQPYPMDLPGGEMIAELYEDLEAEGIPLDALYALDTRQLEATRPVGAGSPAARDNAFRQLAEIAPAFDPEGQRNLVRDRAAHITGSYSQASRYVPDEGAERAPEGTKIAQLENMLMVQGNAIEVLGDEFHVTHLEEHTQFMAEYIQQTEEGQLTLEEAVPILAQIHQHSSEHLQFIEGDPMAQADSARFRQVLQQSGEILTNGMRRLEAQAREAQEAEASGEGGEQVPQEGPGEVKIRLMMDEHAVRMGILQDKAERDTQIALMKANTQAQVLQTKAIAQLSPYSLQRQKR